MAEEATKMVIGNLGASVSVKAKLLKNVHSEAQKLKYDVESLQSFLQLQSSSTCSDQVSKIRLKRAREAVHDAEDVLDDYQLHLDDDESGGVLGLVRKKARAMQIASEIQEVRDKIRDIKIPEIRRKGEDSNNHNSSNSNQVSDPRLDALFIEESDLVGIDVPRRELIEMLLAEEESLSTISVVGMGGLGKTTLVKKVYEQSKRGRLNPSLQFEIFAWIPVSQTYKPTHLLGKMIAQFHIAKGEIHAMAEIELIEMLRCFLEDKRFLVVLDDMWDMDAWKSLKRALPYRKNGSRVIITTRIEDVAKFCSDYIFHLQPLQDFEAWSLFCWNAFRSNDQDKCCPPGLKQLAHSFVNKCRGLPLAIVSLGSLLSVKPHAEWEMIHRSLGSEFETDDHLKSMKKILLLSLDDLPHHLKSCFLFLSIFPEDYEIKRMKLIRLWIAEGLVQSQRGRSLEEVADGYLKQLIQRNLIQVADWKHFEYLCSCQLHDIVREIFIPKYEEEGFFSSSLSSMELEKMPSSSSMLRRLSIYSIKGDETFQRYEKLTRLRSLFMFGVDNALPVIASLAKMRWLRVVDIENAPLEEFPDELTHLPHLRYLSLENTKIKVLPDTVRKLKHLETLNLKGSFIRELPAGILQLQHLRHLLVYKYGQGEWPFQSTGGIRVPAGIGKLRCLQKLAYIDAESGVVAELEGLTELRRLCIIKLKREDGIHLCNSVAKMRLLHALYVVSVDENELLDFQSLSPPPLSLQRLYLHGRLENVPHWIHSLHNLVVLRLAWCKLKDDPLKALQSLPSLVDLELMNAYDGEELCCEAAGCYPKLKRLFLEGLIGLKQVKVENRAMPNLAGLGVLRCKQFENVPLWLQHIPTMKYLDFFDVSEVFKQSMYKEGGQELVDCVRHIRRIWINDELVRGELVDCVPHIQRIWINDELVRGKMSGERFQCVVGGYGGS